MAGGDLKWNKVFGAGLATALVILGVREISSRIYATEAPAKPGYAIQVAEETAGGGAEAADTLPDWGTVLASADVKAGEATFAKCKSCHNADPGGPNGTGPNLNGVVGRPTASHPGFAYSPAMQAHAKQAPNWTYDQLYQFLRSPKAWVPDTKMGFVGLKAPQDRINLIAYLRSQGSSGYPIPAPDPSRAPGAAKTAAAAPAGAAPAGAAGTTAAASDKGAAPGAAAGGPAGQTPATGAAAAPAAEKSAPAK
jgi:cytochrome c